MSENKLKNLCEIFNDKLIFRIPDFQRGYSWEEAQLQDLWEDIQFLQKEKSHYTGMITVQKLDWKRCIAEKWQEDEWLKDLEFAPCYVVDGQQRLTTILILIKELLNTLQEGEKFISTKKKHWEDIFFYKKEDPDEPNTKFSYRFGYEKDNPSDEYFKTKILGNISTKAINEPETLYTKNLLEAKKFFEEKLKDLLHEERATIFRKVVQGLKFNYYEIKDTTEIHVTFETMNNRGKRLSNLELLKNRLIYLSTLIKDSDNLRKGINDVWATIYKEFGDEKLKKVDEDNFLKEHWIMYFEYDRSISDPAKVFLLNEKFTAKNINSNTLTEKDIFDYIRSLQESITQWAKIIKAEHEDEDVKLWLDKLNRLHWRSFRPLAMAVLLKEKDSNKIVEFLKACEKFNFLIIEISERYSNVNNSSFYALTKNYYKGDKGLEDVIAEIEKYIYDEKEGLLDVKRFCNTIEKNYEKEEGFYSWKGLKYFLYEYELFLQEKAKSPKLLLDYEMYSAKNSGDITIEHIFPQSPNDNYWKKNFKTEDSSIYLNSLGNLLLLSREKNSSLSNNSFEEKKNGELSYTTGSQSEIEVARYSDWTKETIVERGKKMLGFLQERWNVTLNEEQIEKLLTNKNKKK